MKVNGIYSEIMRLERVMESYKQAESDAIYYGWEEEALFYHRRFIRAEAELRRAKKAWRRYCDSQQEEAVLVGSF